MSSFDPLARVLTALEDERVYGEIMPLFDGEDPLIRAIQRYLENRHANNRGHFNAEVRRILRKHGSETFLEVFYTLQAREWLRETTYELVTSESLVELHELCRWVNARGRSGLLIFPPEGLERICVHPAEGLAHINPGAGDLNFWDMALRHTRAEIVVEDGRPMSLPQITELEIEIEDVLRFRSTHKRTKEGEGDGLRITFERNSQGSGCEVDVEQHCVGTRVVACARLVGWDGVNRLLLLYSAFKTYNPDTSGDFFFCDKDTRKILTIGEITLLPRSQSPQQDTSNTEG